MVSRDLAEVFAALFLFALEFIIKFCCFRKTPCIKYVLSQLFVALFPFAVLGFTITFCFSRFMQICGIQKRVVGIFSYSSPEDYHWITQGLKSPMFRGSVESTFSSIISNSKRPKFIEDVEKCDFAILYHTKNRGRINLTNVTDSIYDYEIKHMSLCKGRMNVIVVIDDLEKYDFKEKHNILESQPDIANFARDLILVSCKDKTHQQSINSKLQLIGDLMLDESRSSVQYGDYLRSMARWLREIVTHCAPHSSEEGLHEPLIA